MDPDPNPSFQIKTKTIKKSSNRLIFHKYWQIYKLMRIRIWLWIQLITLIRIQILIFIWSGSGSGFYLMRIRVRIQVTIVMRIRIHNTGLQYLLLFNTLLEWTSIHRQKKDCDKKYLQMPAATSLIVVFTWQAVGWLSDTSSWYPHCSYSQRLFFISQAFKEIVFWSISCARNWEKPEQLLICICFLGLLLVVVVNQLLLRGFIDK